MVSRTKLSGKWTLRSPKRRSANENEKASSEQRHQAPSATSEEGVRDTPGPSRLRSPMRAPLSLHKWKGYRKGQPNTHLYSNEDDLSIEPLVDSGGVGSIGRSRSRSPARGLRNLVQNVYRKGPRRGQTTTSAGNNTLSPRPTSGNNATPPQIGPEVIGIHQPENQPEVLPKNKLEGSSSPSQRSYAAGAAEDGIQECDKPTKHSSEAIHNDQVDEGGNDALKNAADGQQPPRIAFIGVFLNGVAVCLASFAPVGGAEAKILVKAVLLDPSTPVLPESRYTSCGSTLAVHMVVDHKNRVYACVTAEDVPFSVVFSMLEEVQIEYLFRVSTLAFTTTESAHNKRCRAHIAQTWAKYEAVEKNLAQERETRRQLGEQPLDMEAPLSGDNKTETGAEVVPLAFKEEYETAALAITRDISLRMLATDAVCGRSPVSSAKRGFKVAGRLVVSCGVTFLLLWAARHTYFSFY